MISEEAILEDPQPSKGKLLDVGLRFSRQDANTLRDGWSESPIDGRVTVCVHHRYIKVDGISFPVFMVVKRAAKKASA